MRKQVVFPLLLILALASYSYAQDKNVKGFEESWVNSRADFKKYEVIYINNVDIKDIKVTTSGVLDEKAEEKEVNGLAKEMRERFSKILSGVLPTETDESKIKGKKALIVNLKLKEAAGTDTTSNLATNIVLGMGLTNAILAMECDIIDAQTGEKIIILSDRHESTGWEENSSLLGTDDLDKWQHAHNIIEIWADKLAEFMAVERGEEYKSQLKAKLF